MRSGGKECEVGDRDENWRMFWEGTWGNVGGQQSDKEPGVHGGAGFRKKLVVGSSKYMKNKGLF